MSVLVDGIGMEMEEKFWEQRWQEGRTGFHKNTVNPVLVKYFNRYQSAGFKKVLVPLCGKSLDLVWLQQHGMQVVGCELSALAVEQFFSENKLDFQIEKRANFNVYHSFGIDIFQGNFFNLNTSEIGAIDWIYDRAAAVALPADMRPLYYEHIESFNAKRVLMVLLNYDKELMSGPPFSIEMEEIEKNFEDRNIVQLEKESFAENPSLAEKLEDGICQVVIELE